MAAQVATRLRSGLEPSGFEFQPIRCAENSCRPARATKVVQGCASTAVRTPARAHICPTAWMMRASLM